ncbi:hypothetical protein BFW87_13125 [Pseudomonas fluorescens]|uniref:PepSY domain-containing protein n=1 Tax=Pseudomonas fluorescens TaxID=294 RepID=A0A1T2YRN5_PSEFL|nr:hypothetical protein [Pseudomonas fluorescens]OPA94990.1 hypothetical protein BFW87_13125 [Pseudomonas fluorescens]
MNCTRTRHTVALTLLASLLCLGTAHAANEELAQEVKESMQETWDKDTSPGENTIKDLTLISRGKNKYRGLVEVDGPDGHETLSVDVMVDEDNLIWEIAD